MKIKEMRITCSTIFLLLLFTGCVDGNKAYVRKAVSIMDKQGI